MKFFSFILFIVFFLFQEPELDTEFDPVEFYNFLIILLGVILIIIILVYIILTSKED